MTNSTGAVVGEQRYLPFGQVREDAGAIAQTDFGYTGQRNPGDDLGLMDYRARFYHPVLARFIQPDTLIPDPYNPQAFNRYSYVVNRPTIYTDPSGYCPGLKPGKKCAANPTITAPVISIPPASTPAPASGGSNDTDNSIYMISNGLEDFQGEVLSPRPAGYDDDDVVEAYTTWRGPDAPVFWWDYVIAGFDLKTYLETNGSITKIV